MSENKSQNIDDQKPESLEANEPSIPKKYFAIKSTHSTSKIVRKVRCRDPKNQNPAYIPDTGI
jgi:hypothetical protein